MKLLFFNLVLVLSFFIIGCGKSSTTNSSNNLSYNWKVLNLKTENNMIIGNIEINTSGKYKNIELSNFNVSIENCNNSRSFVKPSTILNRGILNFTIDIPVNNCTDGKKEIIITGIESAKIIDSNLKEIKKTIVVDIPIFLYKKNNNLFIETNETKFNMIVNSIDTNPVSDKVVNINIIRGANPLYDKETGLIGIKYVLQLIGNNYTPPTEKGRIESGIIVNNKLNKIFNNGILLGNEATNAIFKDNTVNFYDYFVKEGDILVILPNEIKNDPIYLGNWEITRILNKNMLELNGRNSYTETNLSYIIGNNERIISNQILSASINDIEENKSKGIFKFNLNYNPELSGHTGVIYTKFIDSSYHIGNAKKIRFLPLSLNARIDNIHNLLPSTRECEYSYSQRKFTICRWEFNETAKFVINYNMDIGYSNVIANHIPITTKNFKLNDPMCSIRINGIPLNKINDVVFSDEKGNIEVDIIPNGKKCIINYIPDIGYEY